jgi:hypothetical protein
LVLGLHDHREDYADVYLKNHSTYILVEKQEALHTTVEDTPFEDHNVSQDIPLINYIPLLQNCTTLLPKFKLRVVVETAIPRYHPKSPRPANKGGHGLNKSPSRKTKRSKDTKAKHQKDTR